MIPTKDQVGVAVPAINDCTAYKSSRFSLLPDQYECTATPTVTPTAASNTAATATANSSSDSGSFPVYAIVLVVVVPVFLLIGIAAFTFFQCRQKKSDDEEVLRTSAHV